MFRAFRALGVTGNYVDSEEMTAPRVPRVFRFSGSDQPAASFISILEPDVFG
jgi:hypothetical protein